MPEHVSTAIKKLGFESKLVQCVSYRAKVKLVRVQHLSTAAPPGLVRVKTLATTLTLPAPMKLVATDEFFDAVSTVFLVNRLASIGGKLSLSLRMRSLGIALTGLPHLLRNRHQVAR